MSYQQLWKWCLRSGLALLVAIPTVSLGTQAVEAQMDDLVFELINNTSKAIVDFRVDPRSQRNWGPNMLSGVIRPREAVEVIIADDRTDCTYDMYTRWSDGSESVEYDLDLCELGSWTYYE